MGTHGKIIVTSTKDVSIGNIYAGNLSTTGEAAPSTIPATIDIDVTTNSKIGLSHTDSTNNITVEAGIYGTGASETLGPGLSFDTNHVQLPPIPSIIHKVTEAVTMNIKGTAVKKLRFIEYKSKSIINRQNNFFLYE